MTKRVILTVSIDTECDKGPGWKIQHPLIYNSVVKSIPNTLQPLFDTHGVIPTYLLSPEIIDSRECVEVLHSINNCELGTHLHGEFIEPDKNDLPERTSIPQINYSYEVEKQKLSNLTLLFEEKFGYYPTSFRAGRWGAGRNTIRILEDLEYKVDSSIAPFTTHYFQDSMVNYWGAPLQPYYPQRDDARKTGDSKVLEVPATILHPQMIYWPPMILRKLNSRSKLHKKVLGKLGYSSTILWLRPMRSGIEQMVLLTESLIKRFSKQEIILLNMMFHSNELVINGSPYVRSKDDLDLFIHTLEEYFNYLNQNYEVESMGLSEVEKYYQKGKRVDTPIS